MRTLLIDDGCTLDGQVPAQGGVPAVSFRYRPALPEAVYEYTRAQKANGRQELKAVVDLLSAHVISWDVVDAKGDHMPVTADTLRRVPHRVQQRMVDLVTGYGPEQMGADAGN